MLLWAGVLMNNPHKRAKEIILCIFATQIF
jgi:hypothetical protein